MTMNNVERFSVTRQQLAQIASSRARIYGMLSAIYSGLPGERMVKLFLVWYSPEQVTGEVLPPGMAQGFKKIYGWLEKHGGEPSACALLETEFTRLFRGLDREKSPPPPYESVYLDRGLLYGPSTQDVAERYRCYQIAGKNGEPPDHISLELDFMRLLCEKEALAWQTGESADPLVAEEKKFLEEHLARWLPEFCEAVRRFD